MAAKKVGLNRYETAKRSLRPPKSTTDVRKRRKENLAQHTSLRSFAIVKKSAERENVINLLATISPRAAFRSRPGVRRFLSLCPEPSIQSMPIMQFLMHLTFMTRNIPL